MIIVLAFYLVEQISLGKIRKNRHILQKTIYSIRNISSVKFLMSLRVIGAGFRRTGTVSMREALEILGFGPCHHMRELIKDPEHERLWRSVVAGATPDWDLLLADMLPV